VHIGGKIYQNSPWQGKVHKVQDTAKSQYEMLLSYIPQMIRHTVTGIDMQGVMSYLNRHIL